MDITIDMIDRLNCSTEKKQEIKDILASTAILREAVTAFDILTAKVKEQEQILELAHTICRELHNRDQLIKPDRFLLVLDGKIKV